MKNKQIIRQIIIIGNEYKFNQVKGSEFEQAVKFYIGEIKAKSDSKSAILKIAIEMCGSIIKHYETDKLYAKDPFAECYELAKKILKRLA